MKKVFFLVCFILVLSSLYSLNIDHSFKKVDNTNITFTAFDENVEGKIMKKFNSFLDNLYNREKIVLGNELQLKTQGFQCFTAFCYKKYDTFSVFYIKKLDNFKIKGQIEKLFNNHFENIIILDKHLWQTKKLCGTSEGDVNVYWEDFWEDLKENINLVIALDGRYPQSEKIGNIDFIYTKKYFIEDKIFFYIDIFRRDDKWFFAKNTIEKEFFEKDLIERVKNDKNIEKYEINFDEKSFYEGWDNLPKREYITEDVHYWHSKGSDYDSNWIKGDMKFNGQKSKIKLKIRGDLDNHWIGYKKSLNVKLRNEKYKGEHLFKFIKAEDRGLLYYFVYQKILQKKGLHPNVKFVWLNINGTDWGLYYYFQPLEKVFLETNDFSGESSIYKNGLEAEDWGRSISVFVSENLFIKDYGQEIDHSEIYILYKLVRSLNYNKLKNILDIESFETWSFLSSFLGDVHQTDIDNFRLLFDPTSGQFSHITWDPVFNLDSFNDKKAPLVRNLTRVAVILLKQTEIREAVLKKLWESVDEDSLQKDVEELSDFIDTYYYLLEADYFTVFPEEKLTKNDIISKYKKHVLQIRDKFRDMRIIPVKKDNKVESINLVTDYPFEILNFTINNDKYDNFILNDTLNNLANRIKGEFYSNNLKLKARVFESESLLKIKIKNEITNEILDFNFNIK